MEHGSREARPRHFHFKNYTRVSVGGNPKFVAHPLIFLETDLSFLHHLVPSNYVRKPERPATNCRESIGVSYLLERTRPTNSILTLTFRGTTVILGHHSQVRHLSRHLWVGRHSTKGIYIYLVSYFYFLKTSSSPLLSIIFVASFHWITLLPVQ